MDRRPQPARRSGAVLTIRMPVVPEIVVERQPVLAHGLMAYTVLVVDDEPPIRRFLRTSLVASGYRIVERKTRRRYAAIFG